MDKEKFHEEKELIHQNLNILSDIEENRKNKKKIYKLKKEVNLMDFSKEKTRIKLFDKIKELETIEDCSACSQLDGLSVDIAKSFKDKELI